MQTSISAVVLTKNSEDTLSRCLDSLQWCKEIIIIDDNSSDKTIEIAKKYNTKIFIHQLNNNFSEQRNFGLSKASFDWVFFVDSDEIVPKELADEIHQQIEQFYPQFQAFAIRRQDFMWGKRLRFGDTHESYFIRLGRKEKGKWRGKVHEVWNIMGKIGRLKNPIYHYPHPNISEFLSDLNQYSSLRAEELYAKKIKASAIDIVLFPFVKIIYLLVIRQGIRDGVAGIVHALLMSFYSFLVRGKLYLLWKNQRQSLNWNVS